MPKTPPRDNPKNRALRTVHSAAELLQRVSQQAGAARSATEDLRLALPESLRPHLTNVLEKPGELVLFTDSAVWAGRLRLAAAELELAGGRQLTIRVVPREAGRGSTG